MEKERTYQICTRCIMDTTDPLIEFDDEGICNHCKKYFVRVQNEVFTGEEGKARLNQIINTIKTEGKNKEYDCITGISGGVDSTYTLYNLKKLGLRPLVIHLDNGWNTELAVDNIKKTIDTLGFDLYTYVVDWNEFKDIQLAFLKASVANCEVPTDHAINALAFKMAEKYNVRFIIGGGNVATEGILPFSWGYFNQDLKHLKAIYKRFGNGKIKSLPTLKLTKYFYLVMVKKFRLIPILNYLDYKKSEAVKILETELGWRKYGAKHYESVYTRFFQGYILPTKFGYDKRRAHLSSLICSGDISREEAMKEMQANPYLNYDFESDLEFVLKKFEISRDEFEKIMKLPVKTYKDYPSDAFILEKMSKYREKFKKIATKV